MDENNNNEKEFTVDIDKEELKNQTKDTVNQVKETIKNVNFKKDASATKGFVINMIKKPFSTIEEIVLEKENRFPNAVILMICLMVLSGLEYVLSIAFSKYSSGVSFKVLVLDILQPLLFVLAFTVATVVFGGKEKKNITTILTGLTIAYSPKIFTYIASIIYSIININIIGYIYTILSNSINFFTYALMFLVIKNVITNDGDNDKLLRKIAVIAICAYLIIKLLVIIGIY